MCKKCGAVVRPKVTLYGEMLDEEVIEKAVGAIWNADMLIIGGTSLTVYPAASFIDYFKGRNLVVINKEKTTEDAKASLVFYESIGKVLASVVEYTEE